jgi:peptidoglycan/LPS O-acetylase OafA/YrhL
VFLSALPEKTDYLLVLRGLAVIGVMLGHCATIGQNSIGVFISKSPYGVFALPTLPLDSLRFALFCITPILGQNFVVLFFVQSGYLMGKVFHDGRYKLAKSDIISFYWNRYLRLAPLLYFSLFVGAFFPFADRSLIKLIGDIFFVTNFTDRGINLVTWSLSHEMQYYIVCPLVFWAFQKVSWLNTLLCLVTIAVAFALTRNGFLGHFGYLHAFVAGYAVNLLIRLRPQRIAERNKILAVLLGVGAINVLYNWLWIEGYTESAGLATVSISCVLVYLCELPSNHEVSDRHALVGFFVRLGMLVGVLTYGIYLWHYMLIRLLSPNLDKVVKAIGLAQTWEGIIVFHGMQVTCAAVFSFAIAFTTFHLIETYFRPGLYGFGVTRRLLAN